MLGTFIHSDDNVASQCELRMIRTLPVRRMLLHLQARRCGCQAMESWNLCHRRSQSRLWCSHSRAVLSRQKTRRDHQQGQSTVSHSRCSIALSAK